MIEGGKRVKGQKEVRELGLGELGMRERDGEREGRMKETDVGDK